MIYHKLPDFLPNCLEIVKDKEFDMRLLYTIY